MTVSRKIKTLCIIKAHEKYGDILPNTVKERLEREFGKIEKYDRWNDLEKARRFTEMMKSARVKFVACGCVGASFVSYLLELSRVNPLPKFIHNGVEYFDGNNICDESFFGIDGEKNLYFAFAVNKSAIIEMEKMEIPENINIFCYDNFDEKYKMDALCREDVFGFLQKKGLEKRDAYEISEFIRMGKASSFGFSDGDLEKMRMHNVPDEWIESMKNVRFLPSKAFVIEENMQDAM